MQTIFQSTETAFNAITLQDAIIMLPVIDGLCQKRISQLDYIRRKEERERDEDKKYADYDKQKDYNELLQIEDQIRILLKLGFCPSSPAMLQEFNMGED